MGFEACASKRTPPFGSFRAPKRGRPKAGDERESDRGGRDAPSDRYPLRQDDRGKRLAGVLTGKVAHYLSDFM